MSSTIVRSSSSLVYGVLEAAYSGNSFNKAYLNKFLKICSSIKEKNCICLNDITSRLTDKLYADNVEYITILYNDASVLTWISPLAFATIYNIDYSDFDSTIEEIVKITHYSLVVKTAIEYVHLLHDILWDRITPNDIVKILPELNISINSLVIDHNSINDILLASLWCFVHSNDYNSALDKTNNFDKSNDSIRMVTGALAGLYYGNFLVSSIPDNVQIENFIF